MKFKATTVSFVKTIQIQVVYPVHLKDEDVAFVAARTDLSDWDQPEWEIQVDEGRPLEVPCAECQVIPLGRYGGIKPEVGYFEQADVMVMDDYARAFVLPEEATWWIATEEDERQERQNEPNPNQLSLFG